jgi:hypothetical protein
MQRFKSSGSAQKFLSAHAFNVQRDLASAHTQRVLRLTHGHMADCGRSSPIIAEGVAASRSRRSNVTTLYKIRTRQCRYGL